MLIQKIRATVDRVGHVKTTDKGGKFCFIKLRKVHRGDHEDIFDVYVPESKIPELSFIRVGQEVEVSMFLNGTEELIGDRFKYNLNLRLNHINTPVYEESLG